MRGGGGGGGGGGVVRWWQCDGDVVVVLMGVVSEGGCRWWNGCAEGYAPRGRFGLGLSAKSERTIGLEN